MPKDDSDRPTKLAGRFIRNADSGRGAAYEGAVEAVFAILIAVGLGYWADEHFGTSPRYLIVGAVIGFAAFVLRLARMKNLVQATDDAPDDAPAKSPETSAQRSVASRSSDGDRIIPGTDRRPSGDEGRAD